MSEFPQKDYYRLSEVCQYTDTQPYIVRFWESEFPQLGPGAAPDGRNKMYRRSDIDLVQRIKQLLYEEECTLAEARQKLEQEQNGKRRAKPAAKPRTRPASSAAPRAPRAPARPEREVAERRIATALPPREIPDVVPAAEIDVVSRDRYEAAIEEIDHLRLQLKEAERGRRKSDLGAEEADVALEAQRERTRRAIERVERLLERLSQAPPGAP